MIALRALADGFRAVGRSWGLPVLLLVVNLLTAAVLAVPLAGEMERSLAKSRSAHGMLYGFDFPWWSHWHDTRSGHSAAFGPDLFGVGFAFKNAELLLQGYLPLGLFADPPADGDDPPIDPLTLGLGGAYLLVQVFLAGGVLSALRGTQGAWTTRGLWHGSGFYFGRFFRITLVTLALVALVFLVNAPLARWVEHRAREAVSERTAMAWLLGRHALLLFALLGVHLVASYARVVTVLEERSSALLAVVSSLTFCLRHPLRTAGQLALVGLAALALLAVWHGLDTAWGTTGYKTQIVTLLLAQGLMFGRIALRVGLAAGQLALYRRLSAS
ncbi:MAG TPA: hypothetical protein VMT87_12430 [Vicinamibacteria bacterium]|nr:hypothetical protein [Vicinamibacteria bacterium]